MPNKKFQVFLEVGKKLNQQFDTQPILYGSLGLSLLITEDIQVNDIDVLLPDNLVTNRWLELKKVVENLGFVLFDEKEHAFQRDGIEIAFAKDSDLSNKAGVDACELELKNKQNCQYKVLNLKQYLQVYQKMLRDDYRQEKLGKNDKAKIELIKKYL